MLIRYSGPAQAAGRFVTESSSIVVGRPTANQRPDLDLSPDTGVSRRHARIECADGSCWIEDLGSAGGTWINGNRVTGRRLLQPADTVYMGRTSLQIEPSPQDETSAGALVSSLSASESSGTLLLPLRGVGDAAARLARQRLDSFSALSRALATQLEDEALAHTAVAYLQRAIPSAERGGLLLHTNGNLLLKAHLPQGAPTVSLSLAREAIARREAFLWQANADNAVETHTTSLRRHNTGTALYAPLVYDREALGVIYLDSSLPGPRLTEEDLRFLTALAGPIAVALKNQILQQELRRGEAIMANLRSQFSPRIASRLFQQQRRPRLGGERVEPVTILQSDVRGFTALAATMDPDDVVQLLNEIFGAFIPIIFKYDGSVDKYVGDAVLAVFGSPEPDEHQWEKAVQAGLAMQAAMQAMRERVRSLGLPPFEVGIGIHTGSVVHGFIGAEERMEYTVIGDAVNRASRYCDGAAGGEVLISKAVYEHVFHRVEVVPRSIRTKHRELEGDLEGYAVTAWTGAA